MFYKIPFCCALKFFHSIKKEKENIHLGINEHFIVHALTFKQTQTQHTDKTKSNGPRHAGIPDRFTSMLAAATPAPGTLRLSSATTTTTTTTTTLRFSSNAVSRESTDSARSKSLGVRFA